MSAPTSLVPARRWLPLVFQPLVFQPLVFRQYRLLWGGATVSSAGTWTQTLAPGWLAVQLAAADRHPQLGALYLGLVAGRRSPPGLVVSTVAGAIADRNDRAGFR